MELGKYILRGIRNISIPFTKANALGIKGDGVYVMVSVSSLMLTKKSLVKYTKLSSSAKTNGLKSLTRV